MWSEALESAAEATAGDSIRSESLDTQVCMYSYTGCYCSWAPNDGLALNHRQRVRNGDGFHDWYRTLLRRRHQVRSKRWPARKRSTRYSYSNCKRGYRTHGAGALVKCAHTPCRCSIVCAGESCGKA